MKKTVTVLFILLISLPGYCVEKKTENLECEKKIKEIRTLQEEYANKRKSEYCKSEGNGFTWVSYTKKTPEGATFQRDETYYKGVLEEVTITNATGIWELKDKHAVNIKKVMDSLAAKRALSGAKNRRVAGDKDCVLVSCKVEDGTLDGKECFVITETYFYSKNNENLL